MDLNNFFNEIRNANVIVSIDSDTKLLSNNKLSNEALFQIPFISMVLLVMSKGNSKPLVQELGQIVGECFYRTFVAFKGSEQHIGWSANLRMRTIKALQFLEEAGLVKVDNRKSRLQITPLGKKVIESTLSDENDLSSNLKYVERNYRNICKEKNMDMRLEWN